MFKNLHFIKPPIPFPENFTGRNFAPLFRKKFMLSEVKSAKLYVCGLGFGYYFLNGKAVSSDLFTAPVSNYNQTLWYNVYDVTELLKTGENCMAVWCGNGWYNEDFPSSWNYDKADWRDVPKFILRLDVDNKTVLRSDASWKCQPESAIWFNDLRSGEYFDACKYNENWVFTEYDDSSWQDVVLDEIPPQGIFRECKCEPIRECEVLEIKNVIQTDTKKYVFDFGQNISGYIRLTIAGKEGQLLTIRYGEQLKEDNSLELNQMTKHYPNSEFQTDRFICSRNEITWSPRFAYHGFRYIEIDGLDEQTQAKVQAVFVHQDVEIRTNFTCSDTFLNQLFRAGVMSTYCNMFYQITDCPTREKLGWANDVQASVEQILTNFKSEHVLDKWLQDIRDAMKEDGSLPGIIPTAGWGYEWGNGPVSDGVLFEIPYRIYLHTGNSMPLIESAAFFRRYLAYLDTRRNENGFVSFGLPDWACPGLNPVEVPSELINAVLEYRFCEIMDLTEQLAGKTLAGTYRHKAEALKTLIMDTYLTDTGECTIYHQTAVALMIYYHMYENLEPLKQQLKNLIEEANFHHNCGMVGLRRLYKALNQCGLQEYAYKVVTAKGYPGYRAWFNLGATTLWEYWDYERKEDSKNHQMYSDVLSWMVKTILGIQQEEGSVGFAKAKVEPHYFEALDYAAGSCDTRGGKISVSWKRVKETNDQEKILLEITVPEGMEVKHRNQFLKPGVHLIEEVL